MNCRSKRVTASWLHFSTWFVTRIYFICLEKKKYFLNQMEIPDLTRRVLISWCSFYWKSGILKCLRPAVGKQTLLAVSYFSVFILTVLGPKYLCNVIVLLQEGRKTTTRSHLSVIPIITRTTRLYNNHHHQRRRRNRLNYTNSSG